MELKPDFAEVHSNLVCTKVFCSGCDAQTLYEEHRRWNQQHAEPLAKFIQPHLGTNCPGSPLAGWLRLPGLSQPCRVIFHDTSSLAHDHRNFEIFCYADVVRPDGITARLRSYADVWQDIAGLTDEQAAQLIHQDRIDILVDLTMHMARNHLLVFARKPVRPCRYAGLPIKAPPAF